MGMSVYFINHDRVPERAAFMWLQCARAGFRGVQRFSAVDSATIGCPASYRPGDWMDYWGLLPSEIAVFESHRQLWKIVEAGSQPAVILEDDVFLSSTAGSTCERLAEYVDRFDLIRIDSLSWKARLGEEVRLGADVVRPLKSVLPSAAAYLLSPSGARILLERSQAYSDHIDDFLTRAHPGYRSLQLVPAVAIQGMFADLTGRPDIPASIAGSERTSAMPRARSPRGPVLYRLAKEIRRNARHAGRFLYLDRKLLSQGGHIGEVPLTPDLPAFRS